MQGILINPFDQTISKVEVGSGIEGIYQQIQARPFCCVGLDDEGHTLYLDDEGLYREDQRFWFWQGAMDPFCGIGLVLGSDDEGDSVSASDSFRLVVEDHVNWIGDRQTLALLIKAGAFRRAG